MDYIKIFGAYSWTVNTEGQGDKDKNKISIRAINEIVKRVQKRLESYYKNHPNTQCPKLFYSRLRATSGSLVFTSIRERMTSAYAIIFDITGFNPNVMLELGIALELQQHLDNPAKVFLIAYSKEFSENLLPSDIRGYFLTTYYYVDEKKNEITLGDSGSLVMRMTSDILEKLKVSYIEYQNQE